LRLIPILLLLRIVCPANAATIYGDRDGAAAEVKGSIVEQTENLDAPDVTDGYLHITLNVEKVIFGPIQPGQLHVTRWSRERLKARDRHVTLYLNVGRHGWFIWEALGAATTK
jgi:hypothetical protein